MAARRHTRRSDLLRSAWVVLGAWALYSAVRLAIQPLVGWEPAGPDDWARLLQVRAWLDGQSWWDVTQYRIDPPQGFPIHWSRLVDLPLAAAISVLGERWGMALVPLLWLLPALYALRSIMLRLGFSDLAFAIGLVILPLFPMLTVAFAPMRIDHHGPQAALALVCAALLISPRRLATIAAGSVAATWLVISLEALPMVGVMAALYGLRYLGEERRLLPWFLLSLTFSALALSLATRPYSELLGQWCDILRPGHMLAFALATVMAGIGPFLPFQNSWAGRIGSLVLIPLAAVPTAIVLLGQCATDPTPALDPVLLEWWQGYLLESLPFWHQPVSIALMLVWTLIPIVGGYFLAGKGGGFADGAGVSWLLLLLLALSAWVYSLSLMREGIVAQILALPFAAVMLALLVPQARASSNWIARLLAIAGCVFVATPFLITMLGKTLDPLFPTGAKAQTTDASSLAKCDYANLNAVPTGLLFSTMEAGPMILGNSAHGIVAANHHRNREQMADSINVFIGDPDRARSIVAKYDSDYVVICTSTQDFNRYRAANSGNLANSLSEGNIPNWLMPVTGFETGPLRLYHVTPGENPSPRR